MTWSANSLALPLCGLTLYTAPRAPRAGSSGPPGSRDTYSQPSGPTVTSVGTGSNLYVCPAMQAGIFSAAASAAVKRWDRGGSTATVFGLAGLHVDGNDAVGSRVGHVHGVAGNFDAIRDGNRRRPCRRPVRPVAAWPRRWPAGSGSRTGWRRRHCASAPRQPDRRTCGACRRCRCSGYARPAGADPWARPLGSRRSRSFRAAGRSPPRPRQSCCRPPSGLRPRAIRTRRPANSSLTRTEPSYPALTCRGVSKPFASYLRSCAGRRPDRRGGGENGRGRGEDRQD